MIQPTFPTSTATVVRGFGVRGYTVTTLEEMRDALGRERNPNSPVVIDVISDQWETPAQGF